MRYAPACKYGKNSYFGGTFDPVHWGHLLVAQAAVSQFRLDRVIWMPDRVSPHKSRPDLAAFEIRREMVALAIAGRSDFLLAPLAANAGSSFAIDTLLYLQNLYPDDRYCWIAGADAFQTLPKWHRCAEIGNLCDWLVAPRPSFSGVGNEEFSAVGAVEDSGDRPEARELLAEFAGDRAVSYHNNPVCDRSRPVPAEATEFSIESAAESAVFADQNPAAGELCASSIDASYLRQREVLLATNAICRRVAARMAGKSVQIKWEVLAIPAIPIASSSIRRYCAEGRSIGCLVPEAVSNYIAAHRLYRKT
ncbi:MAG: nicotinate-nicotinamide nucleotide adenylyltransferase [Oscillatoriales cyanobacterium RU_3_3]|nr:nicotinate-nicotinamide nucleotide adenylyltransferase [Microcoleus sp. SU_5_6]NJM60803.1 nicotinate-nicotinamide nucleotide adenylyltransferase [Oscillatoriales cyanobacterium RU_3_3]NJR20745.1 nicotinate-nicotinamide nucleotide adenylyltransferase [Richelia sp. CSU_2_1]